MSMRTPFRTAFELPVYAVQVGDTYQNAGVLVLFLMQHRRPLSTWAGAREAHVGFRVCRKVS